MLAGFISRSSRYRYTLLGNNSPTASKRRFNFLVAGLIVVAGVGGFAAVLTFVDFKTLSILPPPSLDDAPPLYQDTPTLNASNHTSPPLAEPEPPLIDSDPHVDRLPPLFSQYHEHELRLPQQDWNRTQPREHEKYFYVSGFRIGMFTYTPPYG